MLLPIGVSGNQDVVEIQIIIYILVCLSVVESYELTNRHTYFAMAIIAGFALVLLLSLAALYKNLAPRSRHMKVTISATAAQTDQAASIVSRRREAVIELG